MQQRIAWGQDHASCEIDLKLDIQHADVLLEALERMETNLEIRRMQRDLLQAVADVVSSYEGEAPAAPAY